VDGGDSSAMSRVFTSQSDDKLCPLKEALWLCTQSFNVKGGSSVHQNDFKRVWIFTNDDHPNAGEVAEQQSVVQVARDGAETGVEISLWHMDIDEHSKFDVFRFYHRLLAVDDEGGGVGESAYEHRVMGAGAAGGFEGMMDLAKRKEHKKRRLGSVRMYLSGGEGEGTANPVEVSVGIYKTVMPAVRPTYEWLQVSCLCDDFMIQFLLIMQASTNEPAAKTSTLIDTSTGQVIPLTDASSGSSSSSLTTYLEVAGSRVSFSKEDMAACRKLAIEGSNTAQTQGDDSAEAAQKEEPEDEAKLKVLFFAPASALTLDMNLTAPCMVSAAIPLLLLYS
jgi:hypothetical protein